VKCVVENIGLKGDPASLTVVYKIGSMPANAADGVVNTFSSVTWANHMTTLTFPQLISGLTAGTTPNVYCRAFLTGEQDITNDGSFDAGLVDNVKVHGDETFNTMVAPDFTKMLGKLDYGWTVVNTNGGAAWQTAAGLVPDGSTALYYPGDAAAANDWIIAPGAFLTGGSSYRVAGSLRTLTGGAQTIELAFGDSPTAAAMVTFATLTNVTNTSWLTFKQLSGNLDPYFNTPNIHQKYYLGIRISSPGGRGGVVIDNLKMDDNPSPPPKIGYGIPGTPITSYISDAAIPIIVVANYKAPGVISKTFSVATTTNIYGASGDFLWDVETSTPWISIVKDVPDPTAQGWNFTPPRPRQFQNFTMNIDASTLLPGVHTGKIRFYGILFNNDFPPPSNGLTATNQIYKVTVQLRVITAGSKAGNPSMAMTVTTPMTAPNVYVFKDPQTNDPIATVKVTSGTINCMTITCYPNALPANISRLLYVKRYWTFQYGGTGWTANVDFPYTDPEAAMVVDRFQLRGVRQALPPGPWEDPIVGTLSISDPLNNSVQVQNLSPANISGNIALAQPYVTPGKDVAAQVPQTCSLGQNFPNPFNPSTAITFSIAMEVPVRLAVYNSLGLEVAVLADETMKPGNYTVSFDASKLASGTYVYRLTAGSFTDTKRMTLSK